MQARRAGKIQWRQRYFTCPARSPHTESGHMSEWLSCASSRSVHKLHHAVHCRRSGDAPILSTRLIGDIKEPAPRSSPAPVSERGGINRDLSSVAPCRGASAPAPSLRCSRSAASDCGTGRCCREQQTPHVRVRILPFQALVDRIVLLLSTGRTHTPFAFGRTHHRLARHHQDLLAATADPPRPDAQRGSSPATVPTMATVPGSPCRLHQLHQVRGCRRKSSPSAGRALAPPPPHRFSSVTATCFTLFPATRRECEATHRAAPPVPSPIRSGMSCATFASALAPIEPVELRTSTFATLG